MLYQKVVQKLFPKFTRKSLCRSIFLIKLQTVFLYMWGIFLGQLLFWTPENGCFSVFSSYSKDLEKICVWESDVDMISVNKVVWNFLVDVLRLWWNYHVGLTKTKKYFFGQKQLPTSFQENYNSQALGMCQKLTFLTGWSSMHFLNKFPASYL